jgi:hypothetical protein
LADRLTGVLFFGLPIFGRIESPTTVVILRLYSDNGIDNRLRAIGDSRF